jgi:hypothetical protein
VKKLALTTTLAALVLSLSACGGGGGGSSNTSSATTPAPTPTLQASSIKLADPTNNYQAAQLAAAYIYYGSKETYQFYLNTLFAVIASANKTGPGTFSSACSGGGTVSVTINDNDNSHSITAGDTASATFSNCQQSATVSGASVPATINGSMMFTMTAATGPVGGTSAYSFSANVTANSFSVATSAVSMTINGMMSIADNYSQANQTHSLTASSSNAMLSRTVGNKQDSVTLAGWKLTDTYSSATATDVVSVSGNFNYSAPLGNAYLVLSTTAPVVVPTNGTPTTGAVTFQTASDAAVVTFGTNGVVSLAIEAGNKGTVTANTSTTMSALASLLTS